MSEPLPFESTTPRFGLPMLFAGQAQKEFFLNEALLRADLLLHGAIEGETSAPPATPSPGQTWLIGASPSGDFAGRTGQLAGWSEAGWRFVLPRDGLRVFDRAQACFRLYAGGWRSQQAPSAPAGGTTVDGEARACLALLIEQLTLAGVLHS